jgi:hypothetical protein
MSLNNDVSWMEETVETVPTNKILYKIVCFFLGKRKKKLTYKDLYIIYTNVYNFKKNDIVKVKEKAIDNIIEIYKINNGKYPDGIE